MDGLAIITGIAMLSFLLFYLAFNLEREHVFLKILTVVAGVIMLIFIPQTIIHLDQDCAVLPDSTYMCYNSDGTVANLSDNTPIGLNILKAFLTYISIFMTYLIGYYTYYLLRYTFKVGKYASKGGIR